MREKVKSTLYKRARNIRVCVPARSENRHRSSLPRKQRLKDNRRLRSNRHRRRLMLFQDKFMFQTQFFQIIQPQILIFPHETKSTDQKQKITDHNPIGTDQFAKKLTTNCSKFFISISS
jgi:hypothetical protein